MTKEKPFWWPDTQGFLSVAIISLMSVIVMLLLLRPIQMDEGTRGVLMVVVGVLVGSLKDVYAFFFGSSKGSAAKDDTINKIASDAKPTVPDSVKALVVFAVLILGALAFPGDASAQTRGPLQLKPLTGNLGNDLGITKPGGLTGSPLNDILGALDDKLLPDLQYAKRMADASGSKVTAPCYQAWIDIITTRQKAVTGADGAPLDLPNPRLITDFEKAVELRNALQPDSDFMRMCSPVANMIKQDMIAFIGKVLAGGAGLATLVPGL